ncbi:hypothetical protein ACGFI9_20680 [Micromonospora sp. NPDC048930]|uniref:hypothetical protein n=1 Tax=Micromonospora sp. NPDC048930 TaxID=3364261 RepID=UPI00371B9C11
MPDVIRRLVLGGSAVALAGGCAVGAGLCLSAPAAAAPAAPTPSPSASSSAGGAPIQVILPSPAPPSTSIGPKDLLVPLGTLLGAALGFGGAVTGARLAANAQDRRAREEAENKRQEEEKARAVKRLEEFADQANNLMGFAATLAMSKPEAWTGGAAAQRDELRLRAAQMLGTSRLLDADLEQSVSAFIGSALDISNAPTAPQARQAAQRCGAAFEALMQAIGDKLSSRPRAGATVPPAGRP